MVDVNKKTLYEIVITGTPVTLWLLACDHVNKIMLTRAMLLHEQVLPS